MTRHNLEEHEVKVDEDNVDAFGGRLRDAMALAGGATNMAKQIGVSTSVLRKWRGGLSEPTRPSLVKIARAAGVSLEWLATGQGPRDNEAMPLSNDADFDFFDDFALVPRYDVQVSTGPGAVAETEEELDKMAFRRQWLEREGLHERHLALVSAKGDSMDPTITEGDILLVDTSRTTVQDDSIYILRVDDDLVAKRLQRDWEGGIWVRSDSDRYHDQHVSEESAKRLSVVGRVVWIGKRI